MQAIPSLLIGDFGQPEFQPVATELSSLGDSIVVPDLRAAMQHITECDLSPDVIVLAQSWPGQFRRADWDQLRTAAPLARALGLLGTWCEGETRTGHPWPGMIRTYWHRWLPRWSEDFRRLALSQLPAWGLPETMSDDERTMATRGAVEQGRGLVAVHSRQFELADMLCGACRELGYASVWLDRESREIRRNGLDAILWDGSVDDLASLEDLRQLTQDAPIVALIDFLRPDEAETLLRAGASSVLAKPLVLNDLFQILEDRISMRPQDRTQLAKHLNAA